jgi:hypothetical protein
MFLHMHADFSDIPAGSYDLVVASKGFRLTVRILVESAPSGRIQ